MATIGVPATSVGTWRMNSVCIKPAWSSWDAPGLRSFIGDGIACLIRLSKKENVLDPEAKARDAQSCAAARD